MNVADLKALLNSYPDDTPVFLVAKSRHKEYDDVAAKEHKVSNDEGDWMKVLPKQPGVTALVFVPA